MSVSFKMSAVSSGQGAGLALHFTRQTELERTGKGGEREPQQGQQELLFEAEDGPGFWTRGMPDYVLREDADADHVAAHVFGWEADIGRAEERLAAEQERGHLSTIDGERIEFRTDEERARETLAPPPKPYAELSPEEREVIRCRAYFSMRDGEESARARRGGGKTVTGYDVIVSFNEPVTNKEAQELLDRFRETPLKVILKKGEKAKLIPNPLRDLPAMFAVHSKGTEHIHGHGQFDCRDMGGSKVKIRPQVWKSFDTHWARIYSEHVRDKKLYQEHVEKKAETEEWKRSTRERAQQNLPPKPHRVADEHDQRLLKVRSQIKTDLLTMGLDPKKFRIAERLRGLRSKDETRRLMAGTELAEARFLHAVATGAEAHKVSAAESQAQALASELRDALSARKEAEKRKPEGEKKPHLFYRTTKQEAELKTLDRERLKAVRDGNRAGILAGHLDLSKAHAETSRKEASEFAKHRNLMAFEVRKGEAWTLAEVEQEFALRTLFVQYSDGEKSYRGMSAAEARENLEELYDVKAKLDEKIAAQEEHLRQKVWADKWRSGLLEKAFEEAKAERARLGKGAPVPQYTVEVYLELDGLGHSLRDPARARRIHEVGRSFRIAPERAQATAEVEVARELVARQELILAEMRYNYALEVERRGNGHRAAEHTKTTLPTQVKEEEYRAAREYLKARQATVTECLKALGLTREEIKPRFSEEEWGRFKEFVWLMPGGKSRAEFERVISRIERPPEKVPEVKKEALLKPSPEREQVPLSDHETADLHAKVLIERARLEAWQVAAERYKFYSLFDPMEVKGQYGETLVWSVAQARYELEKRNFWVIDKNKLAESLRKAEKDIQTKSEALEAQVTSASVSHERALNELARVMEVREEQELRLPEPAFSREQTREMERLLAFTLNSHDLQTLGRAEAAQNLWDATGRAEARSFLALLDFFEDRERHDRGDQQVEKKLGSLDRDHPLAVDLRKYLDYRQGEGMKVSSFAYDAEKAARDLQAQCRERYGQPAPALFQAEEKDSAREKLASVGYHERRIVLKEINSKEPQILSDSGRTEATKFVENISSNLDKYNALDIAREFAYAMAL